MTYTTNRNMVSGFGRRSRVGFGRVFKNAPLPFRVIFCVVPVLVVVGLIVGGFIFSQHLFQVNTYANCQVVGVHYAIDKDGRDSYRVLSSCGTFTANGDIRFGSVSGSGVVSNLVEGETYTFTATGMNQPNMGIVPNIVEIVSVR